MIGQHRVDDAPGRVHLVLTGKQPAVTAHRIQQQPLVRAGSAAALVGGKQLGGLAHQRVATGLDLHPHRNHHFRAEPEAQVIAVPRVVLAEYRLRRAAKLDQHLGRRQRQLLAGAQIERHAGPAPVGNRQPDGGKGFDPGICGNTGFLPVAEILAAHHVAAVQRLDGTQQAGFFVADGLVVAAGRRLHGQAGQHLQQVILDHVPNGAGLLVEMPAAADAKIFRQRDLHIVDVDPVPDRFQKAVGKAEIQQVLHRFLAEVVVDAEHLALAEHAMQHPVQRPRPGQVAPERFFHHDARATGRTGLLQPLDHRREQRGRNGQVVQRVRTARQGDPQSLIGRRVTVVAGDEVQPGFQPRQRGSIGTRVGRQRRLAHPAGECLPVQCGPGHPYHRQVDLAASEQHLQRRKNLAEGQVAAGPENHQRVGGGGLHFSGTGPGPATWPPNW